MKCMLPEMIIKNTAMLHEIFIIFPNFHINIINIKEINTT